MKTSFYFVVWILIYPLLGLLNNPLIDENSFLIAFILVLLLSSALRRAMPATLRYETMSRAAGILELVYTSNVKEFQLHLRRDTWVETAYAVYFISSLAAIIVSILVGMPGQWIALIIFGFIAYGTVMRSVKLQSTLRSLRLDPSPAKTVEIAEEIYHLDYTTYYKERQTHSLQEILPPRPRHFTGFLILSLVIAIVCGILGILYLVYGIIIEARSGFGVADAFAVMLLLYGSLALYFGVRDTITCINQVRRKIPA